MDRNFLQSVAATPTPRDFSSISPSAKLLLLIKSQTTLPFARQAAELVWGAKLAEALEQEAAIPGAERRRQHFETRARSLDRALLEIGATQILEIAAGLSFRGLAMAADGRVFYSDTDLAEIALLKAELVSTLHPMPLAGTLRVWPLNALDADSFRATVRRMPPGPITIVQEGLLLYLDTAEKAVLARCVRDTLFDRGGEWVMADVYVRSDSKMFPGKSTKRFFDQHRVEEKKFRDWGAAEEFFVANGFSIKGKLIPSSEHSRVRETWVLSPNRLA